MTTHYRRVLFGKFLRQNLRPYTLGATEDADLVGMRWYGGGPFHRETKLAMRIAKKTHFKIRTGDVIYNKLFAWKGTFGVVPPALDGMFVSDKFPTYELDREIVDEGYLRWFFRAPDVWEQARLKSSGSAALSKLTLNPPKFLDLEIPLPSTVQEQARIASTLDDVSAKITEAQECRRQAEEEAKALNRSVASQILRAYPAAGTLGDVLRHKPQNGWSPRCDNDPNGTSVLTLSAVTGFKFDATAIKRTSERTDSAARYWLSKGDLLITRSNTPDLVGHAAIYSGEPSPCIYPDLMMKLAVDDAKAYVPFVWHWLQSTIARDYIKKNAKGTSPTMKKISQGIVANIPFPVNLSVSEQQSLVAKLDALDAEIDAVRKHQIETGGGLDAMLPAILDKAFRGEI